jgi:ABC-type nickel/cobalt efflux system permease component RcnA
MAANGFSMTRLLARSFMLQLITLCTALGVLWAPVAEAAECSDEPEVASLVEQHDEPGDEDGEPESHGTCAHGHCHHASQALGRSAEDIASFSVAKLTFGFRPCSLDSGITELATPPPRA